MDKLAAALSIAALLLAVYAVVQPRSAGVSVAAQDHGELAHHMAYLQRYADKLHAAGAAQNWELAAFYLHEIEETAEAVVAGEYQEEGQPLSPLVEALLLPAVERAESASGVPAAFDEAYAGLVASCNACHAASAHGFIEVVVPERPGYPSQRFATGRPPEPTP